MTSVEISKLSPAAQQQIKRQLGRLPKKNKLNAEKTVIVHKDGTKDVFDSNAEYNRYVVLRRMERLGAITDLRRQVEYLLIPKQKKSDGKCEMACKYIADFVYKDATTGEEIVEDVKGYRDPASASYAKYVIKRKLMLERYGITIREVTVDG